MKLALSPGSIKTKKSCLNITSCAIPFICSGDIFSNRSSKKNTLSLSPKFSLLTSSIIFEGGGEREKREKSY